MPILNWIGKEAVVNHDKEVPFRLLRKVKSASVGDNSQNLIIHGDNLEALKALMPYYVGKVKCIYIDPPYNTGNENWVYNDKVNSPKIKKWLGKVVGGESEDLCRHDKWLCMLYPRIRLLRDLLSDDGVIFISIDDNEQANLKLLMDEIFGHDNFISTLIWDLGTGTQAGHFTRSHEYIYVYSKNKNLLSNFSGGEGVIEHSALKKVSYKNPESLFTFRAGTTFEAIDGTELKKEWGGSERMRLISGRMIAISGKLKEDVVLSAGYAQKNQMVSWFNGEETYDSKGQKVLEFYFNKNGILRYKKDRSIINPPTVIRELVNTKNGTNELKEILGISPFNFPKPSKLLQFLFKITTEKDSIVLDSFAGSGTTGHAVLDLNKEDGGNRKFILIEMEDKVAKDITAERVKKAINKYDYNDGFEYCELSKPLFNEAGHIEDECDFNQFATYIYFTETQTNIDPKAIDGNYIGEKADTEYYLIYKEKGKNVLNKAFLKKARKNDYKKIVYADLCELDEKILTDARIVFKQIPYEVKVY